jgi:hypothetical protein
MQRVAIILGGIVVNVVLLDSAFVISADRSRASGQVAVLVNDEPVAQEAAFEAPDGHVLVPDPDGKAVIGTAWNEADGFEPPAPPPPAIPDSISDRQFAHGLWKRGIITVEEAKAFVMVGQMPVALAALVATLPADVRDDAEILISGATVFARNHPFTEILASAFGWSSADTDDFWRYAASL